MVTARMCLRAAGQESNGFEHAASDRNDSDSFEECVLGKHFEANSESGFEGAKCAGSAYSDATLERQ